MALKDDLVGYWKFEDNGNDSSGNGNTLTTSIEGYVTGKIDKGADFEYSNKSYCYIPSDDAGDLHMTGSQTWQAWFKPESLSSTTGRIFSFGRNPNYVELWAGSGGDPIVNIQGLSDTWYAGSSGLLTNGNWSHIIFTYDASAGTAKLWHNGTKVDSSTGLTGSVRDVSSYAFTIGRQSGLDSTDGAIDGILDEVAVWSRALSDEEVGELYNSGDGYAIPLGGGGGIAASKRIINS
jgi:hypothetical protein